MATKRKSAHRFSSAPRARRAVRILLLGALLLALFASSGCVRTYRRRDIEAWLKHEYGLRAFYVSDEPNEITDGEGWHDRLWTVAAFRNTGFPFYITLPEQRFTFHVLDDRYYSLWAENRLRSDYGARLLREEILPQYGEPEHAALFFEEDEEHLLNASLTGSFSDRGELLELCSEARDLLRFAAADGYADELSIRFSFAGAPDGTSAEYRNWVSPDEAAELEEDALTWYDERTGEQSDGDTGRQSDDGAGGTIDYSRESVNG